MMQPVISRVNTATTFVIDVVGYDGQTITGKFTRNGVDVYSTSAVVGEGKASLTFPASYNTEIAKSVIISLSRDGSVFGHNAFDVVVEPISDDVTIANLKDDVNVTLCKYNDEQLQKFIDNAFRDVIRDLKNRNDSEFLYGIADNSIINDLVLTLSLKYAYDSAVRQQDSVYLIHSKVKENRYKELLASRIYIFNEKNETGSTASVSSVRIGV